MSTRCGSSDNRFTEDISLMHGEGLSLNDVQFSKYEMKTDDQGMIEKVYHASVRLVYSMVAAILVSFKMKVIRSGPVSKIKTIIYCDNNGLNTVAPDYDHSVCCKCPDGCSVHDIVTRGCPGIKHPSHFGVPIIRDTDDEHKLEKRNGHIRRYVAKRQSEMSASTRKMSLGYDHLLNHEIVPFIRWALETNRLSLSRLKRWMINACRNSRPIIYEEEERETVLQSLQKVFPRWYDTELLQNLVDWLERHLNADIKEKKSLQTFVSTVDDFFSKRVFVEGVGENKQPNALISIDPEWRHYPATEFHLIYGRAVKALTHMRGYGFTIYFCSVLKECVIRAKIGGALSKFEREIYAESMDSGGDFPVGEEEEFVDSTSMLITGNRLVLLVDESSVDVNVIDGYDLFREKQPLLLDSIKPFKNDFEPEL